MKAAVLSALHSSIVAGLLLSTVTFARARDQEKNPAMQLLAATGSVPVAAAGPYVEIGTFRVQVAAKLGLPSTKFPDGTWLYHHRHIENSEAVGTLVVTFNDGRVSSLTLVTPAVVAALQAKQRKPGASDLVAAK